jgi:hypothetical protein
VVERTSCKARALLERDGYSTDAVGLVFVGDRVTAMALNNYFQHRRSQNALLRNANPEPREQLHRPAGSQGGDASVPNHRNKLGLSTSLPMQVTVI